MPATMLGLRPPMPLVCCLRQLQVVWRSAVERAAALRLLTPAQQAGVVVGDLPMA
uniref:Plt1 n=1 Tax=Arundo donax TaxID=35708 RepID=A0A0A9ENQ1_ARUDO